MRTIKQYKHYTFEKRILRDNYKYRGSPSGFGISRGVFKMPKTRDFSIFGEVPKEH